MFGKKKTETVEVKEPKEPKPKKAVNMKKLGHALNLSKDQVESFAEIHKTFSAELLFASQASGDERQKMMDKAINKDLAYMNYILSPEQYRKYVMLLNVTLLNRGLR